MFYLRYAFQAGATVEEIHQATRIDRWFLENIRQIVNCEEELRALAEADGK